MWTSEALLTAIHEMSPRGCVTEERLVAHTERTFGSVVGSLTLLRKHGLVVKTAKGCHKLTDAGRAAVAEGKTLRSGGKGQAHTGRRFVEGSLRERAWLAMRILRKFSIADLAMRAAQGEEKSIDTNLRDYCRVLIKAGYLVELPVREGGPTKRGYNRYALIDERNTGPKPPVHRQTAGTVWDPNTESEIPLAMEAA